MLYNQRRKDMKFDRAIEESLHLWIKKISSVEFGPACPYAMKALLNNEVVIKNGGEPIENIIPLPEGISVCVVPRIGITYSDLSNLCDEYNEMFPEYLFLDTHPDETLRLRGKETVWEYPAVIIQRRDELLEARSHLMKIGFYKNWDLDLLESLGIDLNID